MLVLKLYLIIGSILNIILNISMIGVKREPINKTTATISAAINTALIVWVIYALK